MAMRNMYRHLAQHVSKVPLCSSRAVHASAVQQSSDAGALAPAAFVGSWSAALPAAADAAASGLQHDVVHSIAAVLRGAEDCVQSLWMAVPKKKARLFCPLCWTTDDSTPTPIAWCLHPLDLCKHQHIYSFALPGHGLTS